VDVGALITQARLEQKFGASRTRICFQRIHQVQLATETIHRVFCDIGVPRLVKTRRRCPKQLKLFEKEHPGDSVQTRREGRRTRAASGPGLDPPTPLRDARVRT
jgi:hypothetical protein